VLKASYCFYAKISLFRIVVCISSCVVVLRQHSTISVCVVDHSLRSRGYVVNWSWSHPLTAAA